MSARTSLLLVRHAPTAATRRSAFPVDEDLDEGGRDEAGRLGGRLRVDGALTSPARRCRRTAELAGLHDVTVDARLAELDFGAWAGRTLEEVAADEPDHLARWCADPVAVSPPGGERLDALAERVDGLLADLHGHRGRLAAVTHGGPIKVAVLRVLGAPLDRLWNVDVSPTSVTELRAHADGGWTLVRCNVVGVGSRGRAPGHGAPGEGGRGSGPVVMRARL